MIIMILLIALTIVSCTFTAIYKYTHRYCDFGEIGEALGFVLSGILTLATFICGAVCIGANQPTIVAQTEYGLNQKIELYQIDKQILETYHIISASNKTVFTSDITFEVLSTQDYYAKVKEYNDKIFKFKCEIKGNQLAKENPWVNWFISNAYMSISDENLNCLEYSIGK